MNRLALTAVLLVAAFPSEAQDLRVIHVEGNPAGAMVSVDGAGVGYSPLDVLLPAGAGRVELRFSATGYIDWAEVIDLDSPPGSLDYELDRRRSTITVTIADDRNPAYDGEISLREALLYARGEREARGRDRFAIDGPVGAGRGDDIVIPQRADGEPVFLFASAALPPLDDPGDRLTGPPERAVITQDEAARIVGPGVMLGNDVSVENVEVDGFDVGFSATADATADLTSTAANGGSIGYEARDGALLVLDGARAAVTFAPTIAINGGSIEGTPDTTIAEPSGTSVLHGGPPGEGQSTWLTGTLTPFGLTALHVRAAAPGPLTEVKGLIYEASSYEAFRPFASKEEAFQKFPRYVADGPEGDVFQWQFVGPASQEYLLARADHPMRTSRFEIDHPRGDSTSYLVRYRFALLDHYDNALWSKHVEAATDTDVIDVPADMDFFGFRIDIIEAVGTGPTITEIRSDVLDSHPYLPRSRSSRLIVFDRPPTGERAVLELNGSLMLLEKDAFLAQHSIKTSGQLTTGSLGRQHLAINLDGMSTADFGATISALDPDRPAIVQLSGTLSIGAPLTIGHTDLTLLGPARFAFAAGAAPLEYSTYGRLELRDLEFEGGGLTSEQYVRVVAKNTRFRDADPALSFQYGDLALEGVTFESGKRAIQMNAGQIFATRSDFRDADIAIDSGDGASLVLIGNRFPRTAVALKARNEAGRGAYTLIGNDWSDAALEVTGPIASKSVILGNRPASTAIPHDQISDTRSSVYTPYALDARQGDASTQVRLVTLSDADARCILPQGPRMTWATATSQFVLLQDRPVELVCGTPSTAVAITLPYGDDDGGTPVLSSEITFEAADTGGANSTESISVTARDEVLADPAVLPPVNSQAREEKSAAILTTLVEAGDFPLAFAMATRDATTVPGTSTDRNLLYVADKWAVTLEQQGDDTAAEQLLTDLADRQPPIASAEDVLVGHLFGQAKVQLDRSAWLGARDIYDRILVRRPNDDVATQNTAYAYQQWVAANFDPANPTAALDQVDAEIAGHPTSAGALREAAAIALDNALVDSLNNGKPEVALPIATTLHDWQPTEQTANNLLAAFQGFAAARIVAGDTGTALATLGDLAARYPDLTELPSVAHNTFGIVVQTAVEAGDTSRGAEVATAYYAAIQNAESEKLLAYAIGSRVDQVLATDGVPAAVDFLRSTIAQYPQATTLAEQGAVALTNHGVSLANSGDNARAIVAFIAALELKPDDEQFRNNLIVTYYNWAVGEANGGNREVAKGIVDEGLSRFPNDGSLLDLRRALAE